MEYRDNARNISVQIQKKMTDQFKIYTIYFTMLYYLTFYYHIGGRKPPLGLHWRLALNIPEEAILRLIGHLIYQINILLDD